MSFHKDEFHQIDSSMYQKLLNLLYEFEKYGDETELEEWNKIILKVQDLQAKSEER